MQGSIMGLQLELNSAASLAAAVLGLRVFSLFTFRFIRESPCSSDAHGLRKRTPHSSKEGFPPKERWKEAGGGWGWPPVAPFRLLIVE